MNRITKKGILLLLAVIMSVSIFGACQKQDEPAATETMQQTESMEPESTMAEDEEKEMAGGLPISDEPITFTAWWPVTQEVISAVGDLSKSEFFKELAERTNISIEFNHPAIGQEGENFNLMIATGNYPDLIYRSALYYAGGGEKAVEDGVYIELNDLIDEFAPNYKKLREENPEVRKMTVSDNGIITSFIDILSDEVDPWIGAVARKDWLEELGIDAPVTYDDWYEMLTAFRVEKEADAPLLLMNTGYPYMTSNFIAGYGFGVGSLDSGLVFQIDGEIKFGPLEPGFIEYVTMMNKWYMEGLVDKDFFVKSGWRADAELIAQGEAGAWDDGLYMQEVYQQASQNPELELIALASPVKTAGDQVHLRRHDFIVRTINSLAVTTACTNPEAAVRWVDYLYGEEGAMLANYGIEGETYEMVDGEPMLTDLIFHNPDGLTGLEAEYKYMLHDGPKYTYVTPKSGGRITEEIAESARVWTSNTDGAYMLPPIEFVGDEGSRVSVLLGDINTLVGEKIVKMIIGAEPLSSYDDFVSQLEAMNIEEVMSIYQAALDRYNAR